MRFASDTRGGQAFLPQLAHAVSGCPQLPTTLPTFDEVLGVDGVDAATIDEAIFGFSKSAAAAAGGAHIQVFTLHAELEGLLLRDAFERLLIRWRQAGAALTRMAAVHEFAMRKALPTRRVVLGKVAGRSGLLAVSADPA